MLKIVSDFLGTFLNVLSCVIFARIVLKKGETISKKSKAIVIVLTTLLLYFFCYLNVTVLKTFIIFLIYVYMFKIFHRLDIGKASIMGFFYFIVQLLSDLATFELFSLMFGEEIKPCCFYIYIFIVAYFS